MKQAEVNEELFKRVVDTSKRAWNAVKEFIRRIRENIRKAVRRFIVINELRKQAVKRRYEARYERDTSWYVNRLMTSKSKQQPMRMQNVTRWIGRRHQ